MVMQCGTNSFLLDIQHIVKPVALLDGMRDEIQETDLSL